MPPARTFSFSTPQGMIYWVHGNPADPRTPAQPPGAASLSQGNIFVIQIAHLSHSSITSQMDQPDFPRGEFDMGILSFFGH